MGGVGASVPQEPLPELTTATPHRSELPRPSRPRSRHCHHTATAWRCSDGSGTQTGPPSRTCLGRLETKVRWGRGWQVTLPGRQVEDGQERPKASLCGGSA